MICQSIDKRKKKVRKHIDPYRAAQARQRKAANQARQVILQTERREAKGDPVRSKPTAFIESLKLTSPQTPNLKDETPLNFFLNSKELTQSLEYSGRLTEPLSHDDTKPAWEKKVEEHAEAHQNAQRALTAIAALDNGSSKDHMRVKIQRCIDEFGRHNTDWVLPQKPASRASPTTTSKALMPRDSRDTGSSEVQAAILTTKIATLADNLHKKDKHNKRNLRVLVHKRQKLLSYLRRKERGGPRWQHLVEKLGISDAMWEGEISL